MFLEKEELKTVATDEIINKIIKGDDSIVESIIEESIDVMSTYLHQYFDTENIFNKVADERNKTILKHLKGIVVYEIYSRRTKTMNEVAKSRYDEAMLWLEKVSEAKIKPPLPIRLADIDGDGTPDTAVPFMKLGSRKSYKNHW